MNEIICIEALHKDVCIKFGYITKMSYCKEASTHRTINIVGILKNERHSCPLMYNDENVDCPFKAMWRPFKALAVTSHYLKRAVRILVVQNLKVPIVCRGPVCFANIRNWDTLKYKRVLREMREREREIGIGTTSPPDNYPPDNYPWTTTPRIVSRVLLSWWLS